MNANKILVMYLVNIIALKSESTASCHLNMTISNISMLMLQSAN